MQDDAISREAVINLTWERPSYTDALNVLTEIRDKVKELPSVTPSRRKGHCELKALIDKHRMYRLADDELTEFERDVLELAESEEQE